MKISSAILQSDCCCLYSLYGIEGLDIFLFSRARASVFSPQVRIKASTYWGIFAGKPDFQKEAPGGRAFREAPPPGHPQKKNGFLGSVSRQSCQFYLSVFACPPFEDIFFEVFFFSVLIFS